MGEYKPATVYKIKEDCMVYKDTDGKDAITKARKGNVFVSSGRIEGDWLWCNSFQGYIRLQYLEEL